MHTQAIAALLAAALAIGQAAWSQAATPPNFLIALADDCTYWDMGCYGGQAATPHMDKLCGEGLRMNRCFQAAPMCSPTRHCLYTGIYPVRSGAWPNHTRVYNGVRSVAHHLGEAGYRVALSGKKHIGPPASFPFEFSVGEATSGANPDFAAVDKLMDECSQSGTPMALFLCSNEPHGPYTKGDPSKYPPEELKLPPFWVDTPTTRRQYSKYLAEITYYDSQVGQALELLEKHGLADNTVVIVLSEQGNGFPFAKWTCYEQGLASGMIVRWPGVVQPGTQSNALVEYVDVAPTMLDIAGVREVTVGGGLDGGLDGQSFVPVLKGETSTHKQHVFGLQTSRGIINGPESYGIRSVRSDRYRYVRNLTPDAEFSNAAMKKREWREWNARAAAGDEHAAALVNRYVRRPAEELFDCEADPHCMTNLADDPTLASIKAELSAKLDDWMRQQGDEGQATEMRAKERQGGREKKEKKKNKKRRQQTA
ncbi:MAG: sulfatase [Planctomycetota bacterium]